MPRMTATTRVGLGLAALLLLSAAGCSSAAGFPSGSVSATFSWHRNAATAALVHPPPQAFSGTVAGVPVAGRAITPAFPSGQGASGTSIPAHLVLVRWTGTFEGTGFALSVSVATSSLAGNPSSVALQVGGTFGSQKVQAVATATAAHQDEISFRGTVGRHHVVGTVRQASQHGASGTATADITVTG